MLIVAMPLMPPPSIDNILTPWPLTGLLYPNIANVSFKISDNSLSVLFCLIFNKVGIAPSYNKKLPITLTKLINLIRTFTEICFASGYLSICIFSSSNLFIISTFDVMF